MQSQLSDEKLIENPAKVEAKLKTADAVAGVVIAATAVACVEEDRWFPPTMEAMMNVIRTGNHDIRSYLQTIHLTT